MDGLRTTDDDSLMLLYLNGRFLNQLDAALDPLDRGVLLGDGVFETIRCEEGQLLFHVAHFARLTRSARLLKIPFSMPPEEMLQICQQVLDANGLGTARLRITLTRGLSTGGPDPHQPQLAPSLIVHAIALDPEPLNQARSEGWRACMSTIPVNHRSPLAQIKSTSYAENLLVREETRCAGMDEAIRLNTDGNLAEAAMANLFLVRGETVLTPPVEDGALPGIIRLKVGLLCGRLGLDYQEQTLTPEGLASADEAFLTNALIELMPLVMVDGEAIGDARPGPITKRLFTEHRRDVDSFLETMRSGGEG